MVFQTAERRFAAKNRRDSDFHAAFYLAASISRDKQIFHLLFSLYDFCMTFREQIESLPKRF
jgi:hypothetical protein